MAALVALAASARLHRPAALPIHAHAAYALRTRVPRGCASSEPDVPPLSFSLALANGKAEPVTLASFDDAIATAEQLAAKHGLSTDAHERLEIDLLNRWLDATDPSLAEESLADDARFPPPPPLSFDLEVAEGVVERVTLASDEDVSDAAATLARRHSLSPSARRDLEEALLERWGAADAPLYAGPSGEALQEVECTLELPEAGVVLEVARSTVGGRGLYLRCGEGVSSVSLPRGTAVCGYAAGAMAARPDAAGGKTVLFRLADLETSVFFEKQLCNVQALLDAPDVREIAGHLVERDEHTQQILSISPDPEYTGARYFVPSEVQPEPLSILHLGQFANDLAIDEVHDEGEEPAEASGRREGAADDGRSAREQYELSSAESNILVLVFRLERDPDDPALLIPTRPVSALARATTFANQIPMELGCHYGANYWDSYSPQLSERPDEATIEDS
ncbi:hypothetical protein AB1Y20_008133 [Prymnesium parvum]|uniref:Uncharacterized protein n=1 Tax=Prymnesium parvum TaxID=97485 RepID=A0AB34IST6_PRYPA